MLNPSNSAVIVLILCSPNHSLNSLLDVLAIEVTIQASPDIELL